MLAVYDSDLCGECGADWTQLRLADRRECETCAAEGLRRRAHGICSLCGRNNRRDGLSKSYCRDCHVKFYGWQVWRKGTGVGIERIPAKARPRAEWRDCVKHGAQFRECRDCRKVLRCIARLWPWCRYTDQVEGRRCRTCRKTYMKAYNRRRNVAHD